MKQQGKAAVWMVVVAVVIGMAAADALAGAASTRTVTCPIDGRSYTVPSWQKQITGRCPITGMLWTWDIPGATGSTTTSSGQSASRNSSQQSSSSPSGQTGSCGGTGRAIVTGCGSGGVSAGGSGGKVQQASSQTCKIKVMK